MEYLDLNALEAIDVREFQNAKPFPWVNPQDLIRPEAWNILERDLPGQDLFDRRFDEPRRAGQDPHDRYSLEYREGLGVAGSWQTFIAELRSPDYRDAICDLFEVPRIEFRFHWHYTPTGCSVSPHMDAVREYGSHLFYFNPPDWDPAWGGETLILDDGGRFPRHSAPGIDEFDRVLSTNSLGNASLLFQGRDHGWHAVLPMRQPADRLRRVFIVVINPVSLFWKIRDRLIGKSIQRL